MRRALAALALLVITLCPRTLTAHAPGQPVRIPIYIGSALIGYAQGLAFASGEMACTLVGGVISCVVGNTVTHAGTCIGEVGDMCTLGEGGVHFNGTHVELPVGTAPVGAECDAAKAGAVFVATGNPTGRMWTVCEGAGGWKTYGTPLIYSNTSSSTAIFNTSTETIFDKNVTFGSGTLKAGMVLRVTASGTFGVQTGTTPTIIYTVRIGGVAGGIACLSPTTTAASGATGQLWRMTCDLIVRSVGSPGTVMASGTSVLQTAASTYIFTPLRSSGTINVDTATTQQLGVTAKWGTAHNNNTTTLETISIEQLG